MNSSTPTQSRQHEWLADGTTVIAMSWVTLTFYGFMHLASVSSIRLGIWTAAFITILVAWSVIERKRWGRLALLGIASCILADAACAVYCLLSVSLTPRETPVLITVERSYIGSPFFGLLILLLCALTILWLLRRSVRDEFERRKRAATRRYQVGIALTLVGICGIGMVRDGALQNAIGLLHFSHPSQNHVLLQTHRLAMQFVLRASAPGARR